MKACALSRPGAPIQTIIDVATSEQADLIMLVSHGAGGLARQDYVKLGSVTEAVLQATPCPVLMVSAVTAQ
ncbi:MAG: universal stress protein [Polyangiaceae bacterium]